MPKEYHQNSRTNSCAQLSIGVIAWLPHRPHACMQETWPSFTTIVYVTWPLSSNIHKPVPYIPDVGLILIDIGLPPPSFPASGSGLGDCYVCIFDGSWGWDSMEQQPGPQPVSIQELSLHAGGDWWPSGIRPWGGSFAKHPGFFKYSVYPSPQCVETHLLSSWRLNRSKLLHHSEIIAQVGLAEPSLVTVVTLNSNECPMSSVPRFRAPKATDVLEGQEPRQVLFVLPLQQVPQALELAIGDQTCDATCELLKRPGLEAPLRPWLYISTQIKKNGPQTPKAQQPAVSLAHQNA